MRDDQGVDLGLRLRVPAARLGDRNQLGLAARIVEHAVADEAVVQDHVGRLERAHRLQRQQFGIARAGADQQHATDRRPHGADAIGGNWEARHGSARRPIGLGNEAVRLKLDLEAVEIVGHQQLASQPRAVVGVRDFVELGEFLAVGGGGRWRQASGTRTWQVAQTQAPPHSALIGRP